MNKLYKALAGSVALCALTTGTAFAGGTQAGTNVQNTFSLNYTVGATPQDEINNDATPTEFTVDRVIDLTVASVANTNVAPDAQDQDLVFTLTNDGNDTQSYNLTTSNIGGDNFDPANVELLYAQDVNGDGVYTLADDGPLQPYTDATDFNVAPDETYLIVVRGDIPDETVVGDGDVSTVALIADTTTADTTTPVLPDNNTTNTLTGAAENVLADGAGTDDNAGEGDHSARGQYLVETAEITAAKTVSIFREDGRSVAGAADCANFGAAVPATEQYSVPGACVEYRITVQNAGTADAVSVVINDVLNENLEYVDSTFIGFSAGAFGAPAEPALGTDCTGDACEVNFENGTLDAQSGGTPTEGVIIIRAILK